MFRGTTDITRLRWNHKWFTTDADSTNNYGEKGFQRVIMKKKNSLFRVTYELFAGSRFAQRFRNARIFSVSFLTFPTFAPGCI